MKTKYFLRGFGVGLIVATLVMFVICSYQTSDSNIKRRAKELGMVYQNNQSQEEDTTTENNTKETTTKNDTKETTTENTQPQQTETQPDTTIASNIETQPDTTIAPSVETQPQTTTTFQETQSPTIIAGGEVQINIHSGMTGVAFARMLEQVDVVENSNDFITYLVNTGYSHRLRAGTFTLRQGMTYDEIIEVVGAKWLQP